MTQNEIIVSAFIYSSQATRDYLDSISSTSNSTAEEKKKLQNDCERWQICCECLAYIFSKEK